MLRIPFFLACFMMILSNLVIAEAAVPGLQATRLEFATWTSTHTGETKISDQNYIAALEQAKQEVAVPEMNAGEIQTLVPMASLQKKIYRLVLVSKMNPGVRAEFALDLTTISVDGEMKKAFVTKEGNMEYRFVITNQNDGTLRVQYTEKKGDMQNAGEFNLQPTFTTL